MDEIVLLIEWLAWRLPKEILSRQAINLKKMFGALKGNARPLMLYNIFWSIPNSFLGIYLQLFMVEQGISKIEIGTIASAQLVAQMAGAFMGGFLAERMGRLRTITLVDGLCWPLAYLFFSTAHGYLGFLAGAVLVGFISTLGPAWTSLYVEGSPASKRMYLFGLLQTSWFAGGMIASLSGFLVYRWGVTTTCRGVFALASVLTVFSLWARARHLKETTPPRRPFRISLSDVKALFRGHIYTLKALASRRRMAIVLGIQILTAAFIVVSGTYSNLYIADPKGLNIPAASLAAFPLVSGAIVLLSTVALVPLITLSGLFGFLLLGVAFMAMSNAIYVLAPAGAFGMVVVGVVAGGAGFAIFNPSLNGYWSNLMDDRERPRILSFTSVIAMLVTMPVPTIAGALYTIRPSLPIVMILCIHATIAACILWVASIKEKPRTPAKAPA